MEENIGKDTKDKIWCDIESPIETRVCMGFLRNLKNQLIEWKFSPECIKVVRDTAVLKVQGAEVATAKVVENEFQVEWLKDDWKEWPELQSSPELAAAIKTSKERLAKSREKTSKGAGKGPAQ